MFRGRFFGLLLAVLLLIGLVSVVSTSAYRTGWSQGLAAGQVADGVEVTPPSGQNFYSYSFYGVPGHGFSPFGWFFGGLLKFFLLFLGIGLIFKLIGLFFWRSAGRGHRHWHGRHGMKPPWDGDMADEPIMKV